MKIKYHKFYSIITLCLLCGAGMVVHPVIVSAEETISPSLPPDFFNFDWILQLFEEKDPDGAQELPGKQISVAMLDEPPYRTPDRVLDTRAGIDVSARSHQGLRSNLIIRGATADQTMISLDGIPMNHPQTAHHNMDLAVPNIHLDKAEIIRGPSPEPQAQGVIGGNVNFLTKRPDADRNEIIASYGTDQTRRTASYFSRAWQDWGVDVSYDETHSNGWRHNTDFRHLALASSVQWQPSQNIRSRGFFGYGEKEFGAALFYGPYDSKEWTDHRVVNWESELKTDTLAVRPMFYTRRHHDKYILDIARPDFYRNDHRTDSRGLIVDADLNYFEWLSIAAGTEISKEKIQSSNIGGHSRHENAFYLTLKNKPEARWDYNITVRVEDYEDYDTEVLPQAGLSFSPVPNIRLRGAAGLGARQPNFTELYYWSPANRGSNKLTTEKAFNAEAGIDVFWGEDNQIEAGFTVFRRDSEELIDWIKNSPGQAFYQAENITELETTGVEFALQANLADEIRLRGNYTYIDSDLKKRGDYTSKYALEHPDHKAAAQCDFLLPFGTQSVTLVYKNRKGRSSDILLGCQLTYDFSETGTAFIKIENIGNTSYEEVVNNPLPNREFTTGIRLTF